ncbi:MAG TPA: endonuclease/exonuclease/phosphatase family protein, partial [Amaricoccus sp.]|nr:endonuclease/exonuclease/phosphatase family protein [Amaricoccus sp.]
MRIATFNINNVMKRLANLLEWLEATRPDVVCLQELKAAEPDFPLKAVEAAGYGAVWRGQRAWNGVAI